MNHRINRSTRGLYAIVDPQVCTDDPLRVAAAILQGGCAAVQLRDKLSDDRQFARLGRALRQLCEQAATPFVINDRFWLAREIGAKAVHVGQTDAPLDTVRRELGRGLHDVSLGLSTHSLAQAEEAELQGADLIGFGPVFGTTSKADADPVVGLEALAAVCGRVRIPVVAIGGISPERAALVARAGAPLAAAISALCAAAAPSEAARSMHAALRGESAGSPTS
jgi:thiamine-phosphate pyrophosphorylase